MATVLVTLTGVVFMATYYADFMQPVPWILGEQWHWYSYSEMQSCGARNGGDDADGNSGDDGGPRLAAERAARGPGGPLRETLLLLYRIRVI
jgi:hypothetical protein